MKNENIFYSLNNEVMDNYLSASENAKLHESWFDKTNIDFWRHDRMFETVRTLASFYKDKKWLTIGDGRFGLDAIRLKEKYSISDILPTDISSSMLKVAKDRNLLDKYKVENAEKLSFDDNSFDIVFCKEAFHHFPRPIIALYEMIRVCKTAVVLIEPPDYPSYSINTKEYLFSFYKVLLSRFIKTIKIPKVISINPLDYEFEESGNYIYSVSTREMEKIAQGLDLGGVAWKMFNDRYEQGCEFEKAVDGNPMFERIKQYISKRDENCKTNPNFYRYGTATFVVFKNEINETLKSDMQNSGYFFPKKMVNPYL